jgi:hypothetical protein
MTSEGRAGVDPLLRLLVAHRLAVYVGGLLVIVAPRLLERFADVVLSPAVRSAVVVTSLALMSVTYLAERRVRRNRDADRSADREEFDLETRIAGALAVLGLAAGIYVAVEVNLFTGAAFAVGAYFFAYLAFRANRGGGRGA